MNLKDFKGREKCKKKSWERIEHLENHHKAHKKSQTVKVLDSLTLASLFHTFRFDRYVLFGVFYQYFFIGFEHFDKSPPKLPEYIVSLIVFVSWTGLEELLFIPSPIPQCSSFFP